MAEDEPHASEDEAAADGGACTAEQLLAEERKRAANRKKRDKAKAAQMRKKAGEADAAAAALGAMSVASSGRVGGSMSSLPAPAEEAAAVGARLLRAVRVDAGSGRGLGLFARHSLDQGATIALSTPALSVLFDSHAAAVCAFCFAAPTRSKEVFTATVCAAVIPDASDPFSPSFSFGLILEDETPAAAAERKTAPAAPAAHLSASPAAGRPVVAGAAVVHEVLLKAASAEEAAKAATEAVAAAEARGERKVHAADVILAVEGRPSSGGKHGVAAMLRAAALDAWRRAAAAAATPAATALAPGAAGAEAGGDTPGGSGVDAGVNAGVAEVGVKCTVERRYLTVCRRCGKLAACAECVAAGRLQWHRHECHAFCCLPPGATGGADTSVVRMLLRYRAALVPEVGDWRKDKEQVAQLRTLQKNPTGKIPSNTLAALSAATGVSSKECAALVAAIRTNAAQIQRMGAKVGCALSVLLGWHNHSCRPNAAASIDADGLLHVVALQPIAMAEEITISYVDTEGSLDTRRATLSEHYNFDCGCERCLEENRQALKHKMRSSRR